MALESDGLSDVATETKGGRVFAKGQFRHHKLIMYNLK